MRLSAYFNEPANSDFYGWLFQKTFRKAIDFSNTELQRLHFVQSTAEANMVGGLSQSAIFFLFFDYEKGNPGRKYARGKLLESKDTIFLKTFSSPNHPWFQLDLRSKRKDANVCSKHFENGAMSQNCMLPVHESVIHPLCATACSGVWILVSSYLYSQDFQKVFIVQSVRSAPPSESKIFKVLPVRSSTMLKTFLNALNLSNIFEDRYIVFPLKFLSIHVRNKRSLSFDLVGIGSQILLSPTSRTVDVFCTKRLYYQGGTIQTI